jgi:hypothetical protein
MTFTVLQNPLRTRLHTKGEAAFVVPPHWHTMHDEHHTVLKGTLTVIQDGVRRVVRPEDGPLLTRRGVVHSLEILPGEEAIVEETTLQSDDVVGLILCTMPRGARISTVMYRPNRKLCFSATYSFQAFILLKVLCRF